MSYTLIIANTGLTAETEMSILLGDVDEVIEVLFDSDKTIKDSVPEGMKYRTLHQKIIGTSHAFNLGISFASSEWVIFIYGDEHLKEGWLKNMQQLISHDDESIAHLFYSKDSLKLPLIVIRRVAFVYGPLDEMYKCERLSILHWVFNIFPTRKHRLFSDEDIRSHFESYISIDEKISFSSPLNSLITLWKHLHVDLRVVLLNQLLNMPEGIKGELSTLLENEIKNNVQSVNYFDEREYISKKFWEIDVTKNIRWEVYQPDEKEICSVLSKVSACSVLELGCGAGRNTRYFSDIPVYAGIDISMNLLSRSIEKQESNSMGVMCGNIETLPISDASFDIIFSDSSVQHIKPENISNCILELVRVTAKYICLIEYTEEEIIGGTWFDQIHMFAHDYRKLLEPYARLIWHADTELKVHPARKEVFLFEIY